MIAMNAIEKQIRLSIIRDINEAFADVQLEDGVTLRQARVMDHFWLSKSEVTKPGTEGRWQDISDSKLCQFNDVLAFLDRKGLQFYLPAFMIWTLKHLDDGPHSKHSGLNDSTTFAVMNFRPDNLITDKQGKAIYRFFDFICHLQYPGTGKWYEYLAAQAENDYKEFLAAGWRKFSD